jgi:diguanylate cyclase (GGDEF)-like protein
VTALESALEYANQGWRVIPILPGEKRPALTRWTEQATTDAHTIKEWWDGHDDYGVGIATGPGSGFWVLDVDDYESFRDLELRYEALPATRTSITGSGGYHFLFRWPDDGRDIRNDAERYAFVLWAPLLLTGLLLALRGLELGFFPGTVAAVRGLQLLDDSFLWIAIVVALLQNTSLAFLVLLRLVLRIQQLHESDVLTGALNRRAFEAALVRAHHDARRDEPYALVMLDMDHFKRLNDNLGHAAGDAALRLMVQAVSPCLREVDRLGRLGGEEFAVLLPRTSLAGAALVADRMRTLLAERAFDWKGQAWPLSASFGIAEVEPGDANAEAVLARADAGLYLAKSQGRNIVQSI